MFGPGFKGGLFRGGEDDQCGFADQRFEVASGREAHTAGK